jgi:hypothetical protein
MALDLPPKAVLWLPPKPAIIRASDRKREATFPFPAFVPGSETDPYFSNVVALLHFDGANGSTTFTDKAPSPHGISVSGSVSISTAQSVFGGSSCSFGGGGAYLYTSSSADFAFPGDFTIEMRVRFAAVGSTQNLIVIQSNGGLGWDNGWRISRSFVGTNWSSGWSPSAGVWYALALARSGSTMRIFVDGVLNASSTDTTSFSSGPLNIGGNGGNGLNGWMDELRITNGVCRYTGNYTVRSLPFPDA